MKIAFVIASHGDVSLDFALALSYLLKHTNYEAEVIVSKHYNIDFARNDGVIAALNAKASHILFLDTDIVPCKYEDGYYKIFPDAVNYMLSFDYPVVSGIYASKKDFKPAVYDYDEEKIFVRTSKSFEDFLNRETFVDGVGLGFTLIKSEVFGIVRKAGYFPFFEYKRDYEKQIEISEDLYFFKILHDLGIRVLLAGKVVCLHIGKFKIRPDGTFEYSVLSD